MEIECCFEVLLLLLPRVESARFSGISADRTLYLQDREGGGGIENHFHAVKIEMSAYEHVIFESAMCLRTVLPVLIEPVYLFSHGHTSSLATQSVELGR